MSIEQEQTELTEKQKMFLDEIRTASVSSVSSCSLPTSLSLAVGQEISLNIKGVTNDRRYNVSAEILRIEGMYGLVRYGQPWAHPRMREEWVDLRGKTVIKRRIAKKLANSLTH